MTTAFVRRAQYQAASNARATAKVPRNTALLTAADKAAADAGLGEGERGRRLPDCPSHQAVGIAPAPEAERAPPSGGEGRQPVEADCRLGSLFSARPTSVPCPRRERRDMHKHKRVT